MTIPAAISSLPQVDSHVAHPHVAPCPVQSCASSAPPPTLPTSHSNVDISNVALSSPPHVASRPCVPPCAMRASVSSAPSSTPPISHSNLESSSSSSPFTYRFTPMPRPRSATAPSFDGKNLSDFLDILIRHGEHAGLTPDQLTPIIISYCTPEVQRVVRYLPELQRDARSWDDAVFELRDLYSSDDGVVTYTIADLHDLCSRTCVGPPFRWLWDAEAYLRRFQPISGYLRHLGFLTSAEVQVYFVAGLPFATRKNVEAQLPVANRGTDSPPTKHQVMNILRDLLRRDSFEAFVAARLSPSRPSSSPSSDAPNPSVAQSRTEFKPQRRSHRCFVCGGTGTHRLGPKFCPWTWELIECGLARFNPDGRLVSHDGTSLPMTRNSGGVAAHLFAYLDRRRPHPQNAPHVASPSFVRDANVPAPNTSSNSNPPRFPIALRRPPSPLLPPTSLALNIDADTLSPPRANLNPPHRSSPPRVRTAPVVISIPKPSSSASNEINDPHPTLPAPAVPSSRHTPPLPNFNLNPPHSLSSNSPPSPSSIHPSHHDSAPKLSDFDVDPKQLVTLSFADLLVISPPMRANVAAFIRHLDSKSVSKPVHDLRPLPDTPFFVPNSFNSTRKFFAASVSSSSLILVLIAWALSSYISSTAKHLGYYGYLTHMISFHLSHATRLLMDYILI
ncbi:hypothetical protein C8J57DRAFT_1492681 [Mycena rebaudengoi]|nr:hypothetical protein C8J57DRAFT_1492681 [Mycena rebaudengoi]